MVLLFHRPKNLYHLYIQPLINENNKIIITERLDTLEETFYNWTFIPYYRILSRAFK
jgi:hypothetical protein